MREAAALLLPLYAAADENEAARIAAGLALPRGAAREGGRALPARAAAPAAAPEASGEAITAARVALRGARAAVREAVALDAATVALTLAEALARAHPLAFERWRSALERGGARSAALWVLLHASIGGS
jgi:hypothetical protein